LGRRDLHRQFFQGPAAEHDVRVKLPARQVAAVERDLAGLPRLDHRGEDGVDPRRGGDAQAVKQVRPADLVGELHQADLVVAVFVQGQVHQAVGQRGGAVGGDLVVVLVQHLDLGGQLAVDGAALAVDQDALAALPGEDVVIHVGRRGDGAVDGGVDLD